MLCCVVLRAHQLTGRHQKPESEQTDFEKALLNVEYDEDDTPAILAKRCKEKGNAMFKRGEAYFGNALRHYKVDLTHATCWCRSWCS